MNENEKATERDYNSANIKQFIAATMTGMQVDDFEVIQLVNRIMSVAQQPLETRDEETTVESNVHHLIAAQLVIFHYLMDTQESLQIPLASTLSMFVKHLPALRPEVIERIAQGAPEKLQ